MSLAIFWNKPVICISVLLSYATGVMGQDSTITPAPADMTIMTLQDGERLSDNSPATVVMFAPSAGGKPPDNLLMIRAGNDHLAVSLRLQFRDQHILSSYTVSDAKYRIELAVGIDDVTYLAHSGGVQFWLDGTRLNGRITNARMQPLQSEHSAFTFSATLSAVIDLTCWINSQDSLANDSAGGYYLDAGNSHPYCQKLSISELLITDTGQ